MNKRCHVSSTYCVLGTAKSMTDISFRDVVIAFPLQKRIQLREVKGAGHPWSQKPG